MPPAKTRINANRNHSSLLPGAILAVAAAIVGVAISLNGMPARLVNAVGVAFWIIASFLLLRDVLADSNRWQGFVSVTIGVGVLAFVVRPSDLLAAVVGFSVAGAVIALVVLDRPIQWALLLPAAWLPAHIVVAIGRSIMAGSSSVRTDPPPTTSVVPLAMVVAAMAGSYTIARIKGAFVPASSSTPIRTR